MEVFRVWANANPLIFGLLVGGVLFFGVLLMCVRYQQQLDREKQEK